MTPKNRVFYPRSIVSDSPVIPAEATAQLIRISTDGGYSDNDAKLSSFIGNLKAGSGGSGDCYALFDGIWIPGFCKKDAANKISKFYDLSPQKSTSLGINGYYDAVQSTAASQQTLGRDDTKGNIIRYSQTLTNAAWLSYNGASATSTTVSFGTGGADSQWHQYVNLRNGKTYKLRVLASGSKSFRLKFYNGSTDFYSADFTPTATPTWYEFSWTGTGMTGQPNVAIANQSAGGAGTVTVGAFHLIESTWDATYIETTDTMRYPTHDGWPVAQFISSLGDYRATNVATKAQPGTLFAVVRRETHNGTYKGIFDFATFRWHYAYQNNTTSVQMWSGGLVSGSLNQHAFARHKVRFNSVASFININGTNIASGDAGNGTSGGDIILGGSQDNFRLDGMVAFWGLIRQSITTAQESHIQSVLAAHFPTTA